MKSLIIGFLSLLLPVTVFAQSKSVLIEDLTWTEVRDAIAAGKTTAIYYAASTEQNGPGLALGKHIFIAHYAAQRIAEELGNALVYPTMPYAVAGDSTKKTGHMRFPGTVSISEETFGAVARDVALSAIAAGFRNVALMGDHGGGQQTLKKVAESLNTEWSAKGVHVFHISDLYFKEKEQMKEYLTKRNMAIDQHAGIDDTSELCSSTKKTNGFVRTNLHRTTGRWASSATRRKRLLN